MKKFFVNKENINGDTVFIEGEELHHFSNVLRTKVNEEVKVICGSDKIYTCRVSEINKKCAKLVILNEDICMANPKFNITLFQGLAKGEKLDLIVQKTTELGATALIPFESDFTVAKNNDLRLDRLRKIAIEACKQCGRSTPLKIYSTRQFKDLFEELEKFDIVLFLYEKANFENTINSQLNNIITAHNIAVIVGAEGGFSINESQALLNEKNVKSISLGKRILRTETAAITLVGLISILKNN